MEFEDMKQIWDTQNQKVLYAIDEKALHKRITSKKKKTLHITNFTELVGIIVNFVAGILILATISFKHLENISMILMAIWLFGTALYVLVGRVRRIKGNHRFDRSMQGDLDQSISVATYQVHYSQIMRWNILPIGGLSILSFWEGGKSFWLLIGLLIFFLLAYYAGGWEHNMYSARKRELEALKKKLQQEEVQGERND